MKVRPARAEDAAAIAGLWNAMIRDTLPTFTTQEKTVAEVAEMIALRPGFWVLEDGAVEGFVTYGAFRAGPGYAATVEHSIVLAPAAQGRGGGRALLQTALEQAAAEGRHVMVAAISGANPGAVAFHERLGFRTVGRLPETGRKGGRWLDLILMQKMLESR